MANLKGKDFDGAAAYVKATGAGTDGDPFIIVHALAAGTQVQLTDGTDVATIRDVTGAKAIDVSIVDGSGNQITSFGGGTQYAEGATAATITGTAIMWEDTSDTLRPASVAKPLPVAGQATENHLGEVGGKAVTPSANFTRPADTTQYAVGDLVANSTTAGSVVPLSWSTAVRVAGSSCVIRRVRLRKSGTSLTSAAFRVHFYGTDPSAATGIANGDNGAWSTKVADYLGAVDVVMDRAFTDAAQGVGIPIVGGEITFVPASGTTVYALVEARGTYTPVSAEVFTCILEDWQN